MFLPPRLPFSLSILPVDMASSLVNPAVKLVVVASKKVNKQRPSKNVAKGDKYMNDARDEFEQFGHAIPPKEASVLWGKSEE